MAVQLLDTGGSNKLKIDAQSAARVTPYHPDLVSNGAYRLAASSGLLTVVAAGTASAGHLFAARWTHASKLAVITRLGLRLQIVTGFTIAQEIGLDASIVRSYSAAHSGGTALTLGGNSFKKRASHATTNFSDIRIATTGALTSGTQTFDGNPFLALTGQALAALATVQNASMNDEFDIGSFGRHPIVLAQNEGLVVRNVILMGAAGTARLVVDMDWQEVDSY